MTGEVGWSDCLLFVVVVVVVVVVAGAFVSWCFRFSSSSGGVVAVGCYKILAPRHTLRGVDHRQKSRPPLSITSERCETGRGRAAPLFYLALCCEVSGRACVCLQLTRKPLQQLLVTTIDAWRFRDSYKQIQVTWVTVVSR
uniref:(northern house mosquito) hypothetical protein n=1 Tax=Culex pipiens TaxID=7175 RepID=A0A8D8CJ80_CULPI